MPKSEFIDPTVVRKKSEIHFNPIPVNQYDRDIQEEKVRYSTGQFLNVFRDMAIIREFESMLNLIKTTGEYNGISYNHPGPAHLSIGQEAAAVGMAFHLDEHDYIFGSHRSHGEILAKGLSAIEKMNDDRLLHIMKTYFNGDCLKIVEKGHKGDVKDLAINFLLYGTLAEIFGKKFGFNKGMGGSMHAFFTPFGIYPNNAIVGGSGDISVGAALYKKINSRKGIVVANIGDASMGCGPVWEGIAFATMDQYTQLWEGDYKGGLPLIFNFMNNQYGMGGQTCGETMGYSVLARIGAGVNPEQMHAERIDGYDPLAVMDAFERKIKVLKDKKGPVLMDTLTYRISGHSPSDASSYRTKEEIEAWDNQDSILTFGRKLLKAQITDQGTLDGILSAIVSRTEKILRLAGDMDISPRLDLISDPNAIGHYMFSNTPTEKFDNRKPEVNHSWDENPRIQQIRKKERFGIKEGKPVPKIKAYNFRDGVFEAIFHRYFTDPTLVAFGEENRDWGGAFAVYRGLTEALPYNRLFNTSISEGAIVGVATGYGMCGGRAIPELMYCDFLGRAGDEVFNQLPKWQAMSGGHLKMPVVLRVSVGSKYGAQHSQDWTSIVSHIPGLKVVFPATPYDAKGLMNAALQGSDPVVFFESQRIYDIPELFHKEGVPEGYYEIPIGEPEIKRPGEDITILSIGATLYKTVDAADELEKKYGMKAEIIDARSLVPFNYDLVIESIKKTGRVILVSDACERGSILRDMASNITEFAFDFLDGPPVVVGSRNWITPPYEMEEYFFPQVSWILDAIHLKVLPLEGHAIRNDLGNREKLDRAKKGV